MKIHNMWEHTGWGRAISWSHFGQRTIQGHLTPRLDVGDEVRAKMKSGQIARFTVVKVEYCEDPNDMFFATVSDNGYVGEDEQREGEW